MQSYRVKAVPNVGVKRAMLSRRCLCGGGVGAVLPVLCRSGLSERIEPGGWEEPRVPVGAHLDCPPVVMDDPVVVSTEEDEVIQIG